MSARDPRDLLADAARLFYERGWMMGTAGNLSLRLAGRHLLDHRQRQAEGAAPAGGLPARGARRRGGGAGPRPEDRPSAETSLHDAIYRLFPEAGACFHVHSIPGNVAARLAEGGRAPPAAAGDDQGLRASGTRSPQCRLAVFPNHLHVPRIAEEMLARFRAPARRRCPGS